MATNNIINSNSTAITATSGVLFGNGASNLNFYDEFQSFVPVFTFSTAGDLSVVSTTPLGTFSRIGNIVYIEIRLNVTPTYTTSSGDVRVTGLNYSANASSPSVGIFVATNATIPYPVGVTTPVTLIGAGNNYLNISGYGASVGLTNFSTTQFVSGLNYQFRLFVTYLV